MYKRQVQSIRGVLAKAGIDPHTVAGIGLTGQMHGLVLLLSLIHI